MTRVRRVTAFATLVAGAMAGLAGCGDPAEETERPGDGRLVWVSGRDDHGQLELEDVPLYDSVDGDNVVATVPDGTLAAVTARDGVWLEVRTVEGEPARGWIDDFRLRGQVRIVGDAPSCESVIGSQSRPGGTLVTVWQTREDQVLVETVAEPRLRGHTPREHLQELPPQGDDCGEDPPGQRHQH